MHSHVHSPVHSPVHSHVHSDVHSQAPGSTNISHQRGGRGPEGEPLPGCFDRWSLGAVLSPGLGPLGPSVCVCVCVCVCACVCACVLDAS